MSKIACVLLLLYLYCTPLFSQDSIPVLEKITAFPDKLFNGINKKADQLVDKLNCSSEKALEQLERQENKLKRKLAKKDSIAAKELFGDVNERYALLKNKLTEKQALNKFTNLYSGHLDSMRTSLNFLNGNGLLDQSPAMQGKLGKVMDNFNKSQEKFNQTDQIRKYLDERKRLLREKLEKFGMMKELKNFQKKVFYYKAQVEEYKRIYQDPSRIEQNLLKLAGKLPAFKKFFAKHSELGGIFRLPGNGDEPSTLDIAGLQTRSQLNGTIQERIGGNINPAQVVQQNISAVQSQIDKAKDKLKSSGNGDPDLPSFKPNTQKTKSFLKRIEFGTNFQSTKSNAYWPVTSDIGLSVGYKLNDKGVIGIGGSYKLGWGKDIRHIVITHEGIGIRSFIDWKLKGSFYISGGYEQNYRERFENMQQLKLTDQWQQSGLIGISKVLSIKSRLFKKTKAQLLWDFLSYRQLPREQPVKFRVGYNF